MKRITSRFVMLIATAAVLPLIVYGFVSMGRLQEGTETSVREGNLEVAEQVASQLKLYVDNNARILRSVGQELSATSLAQWQQTRILTNHVLEFPEFRELSLLDASGRTIATSRIGGSRARLPAPSDRSTQGVHVADVFLDDDALPTTDLSVRLRRRRPGLAGRPALARGALALRRHRPRRPAGLRAGLRRRPAAHRPRRSGEEADRGAGGNGSGQPAVGGRRARRRARVGGDVPRDLRRRQPRPVAGHARPRAGTELDGDGRAADQRSVRGVRRDERAAARRHRPLAARHRRRRLGVGARLHHAHLRADRGDAGDCRGAPGRAGQHQRQRRDPPARRRRSTRWPIASSSCRRTSGSRNGRRCSDGSRRAWSTICRIRFRTSATAAS